MNYLHRAWAEINLDALVHNFKIIRSMTDAKIFSVVKADAYGHSAKAIARALDEAGTDFFAVSNIEEAKELREIGITKPILVLGYTPASLAYELSEYDITQTVFSYDFANKLNEQANKAGVVVRTHIKLDTGMGRIGFNFRDNDFKELDDAKELVYLKNLDFEGIFTHFPVADGVSPEDVNYTKESFDRFIKATQILEDNGFNFKIKHCCNSAATLNYPEMHLDAVRVGVILFGLTPSSNMDIGKSLLPVMTFKAAVSMVKPVLRGETVNYGRSYTFDQDAKVATVSAGYADGVMRLLSNNGRVLINGKYAPIVGRICMDQFCIDVTDIDTDEGDIVTIFGEGLPVDEQAEKAQTINYELVCGIAKRVAKVFIKNGEKIVL